MTSATACKHCNEPCIDRVDFCCNGCEGAYHVVKGLGLDKYYKNRVIDENMRPLIPSDNSALNFDDFTIINDSTSTLYLMVDGVHCAACIWLIETVLAKETGIIEGRMNMSTRRLTIKWDNSKTDATTLLKQINQLGYRLMPYDPETLENKDKEAEKSLLIALAVAGFASMNIMLLSVAIWSGADLQPHTRNFFEWLSALIGLPTLIYAGRPFYTSAFESLKHKRVNMDVPISLAVITTGALSLFETITRYGDTYFDSAIMLLFFLLIGRYLDMRTRGKARGIAEQLGTLQVASATLITNNNRHKTVATKDLKVGDIILVSRGESIAADGVIVQGDSHIDSSMMTGESLPLSVHLNDTVHAGCLNIDNPIQVKITATGNETALAEIANLVEQATNSKSTYTRIADRAAQLYAPIVHTLAAATLSFWWWHTGNFHDALLVAVSVLIITCPCAIALAVPAVQVAVNSKLLRMGIIIKNSDALEKLKNIKHVFFDKTGTLTLGQLSLKANLNNHDLQIAASLAQNSKHPLSVALTKIFNGAFLSLKNIKEIAGKGIEAEYNGSRIALGNTAFCGVTKSKKTHSAHTWFICGNNTPTLLEFEDTLRPQSKSTVSKFDAVAIKSSVLSGDQNESVQVVSSACGIHSYYAQQTPKDKHDIIINEGLALMVGDGINDAPSLAAAHVGITFSNASDIARTSADIIIQNQTLNSVWQVYQAAKQAHNAIIINFAIALAYNSVAIPLAMMGKITPLWAAVFMSTSSLTVMLNSLRLAKK